MTDRPLILPPLRRTAKLAPKISSAQRRALLGIRDYGNSAHGLRGASEMGGASNTVLWLFRQGLSTWNSQSDRQELTERGHRVLAAGRLVE